MIDLYNNSAVMAPGEHLRPYNSDGNGDINYWGDAAVGEEFIIDTQAQNTLTIQAPAGAYSIEVSNYPYRQVDTVKSANKDPDARMLVPSSTPNKMQEITENPDSIFAVMGATTSDFATLNVASISQVKLVAVTGGEVHIEVSSQVAETSGIPSLEPPKIDTEVFLFEDQGTNFFYTGEYQYDDLGAFVGINYIALNGGPVPPVAPVPVNNEDYEVVQECKVAIADGVGYSVGDKFKLITILGTSPFGVIGSTYINDGVEITPATSDFVDCDELPRENRGTEVIVFTDAVVSQLTRPLTANHAEIHVHGGDIIATTQGNTPVDSSDIGVRQNKGAYIELESVDEIDGFRFTGLSLESGNIYVEYFYVPRNGYLNS